MADENSKIEINNPPPKKINNSRETFLFENENLIIGKKGLSFQYYPTKNEKLNYYLNIKYDKYKNNTSNSFYKTFYSNKNSFNNTGSLEKKFYNERINKNTLLDNKLEIIPKSMSQTNYFQNPWIGNNKSINNSKTKNTNSSIKSSPHIQMKSKLINQDKFKNNNNISFNKTEKNFLRIYNSKIQPENKFLKKYPSLSKLKKIKDDYNKKSDIISYKTHFKGIESIYIKPKEIYDLFKKEDSDRLAKLGFYNINEKNRKEIQEIEKKNEYKNDIKELIEEEKIIQNVVNSKGFAEFLGNNKYLQDAEYSDMSQYSMEEIKNNCSSNNKEEKNKKMNYLKKIAFEKEKMENSTKLQDLQLNSVQKKIGNNKKDDESENESLSEETKKSKKIEDINRVMEKEDQLFVDGKLYHMKKQIDKICKELLNKYKIHNILKK